MLPLAAGIYRPAFVSTTILCTPILDYEEDYLVKSHEMDSLLKYIFSNPNGLLTCYSMYPQK